MKSPRPLISVIVPCYNQGNFLPATLQSVSDQIYLEWECLIINDGSLDETEKIATEWCNQDRRFRYFYKTNGGLSSARNKGLDEAIGEYVQFLDADDLLAPPKFTASIEASGAADIIMSGFQFFTKIGQPFTVPSFSLNVDHFNLTVLLTGWDRDFFFPPHAGLFKADLFKNKRFDETLRAREDWVMWLDLFMESPPPTTIFIDEPYAWYRTNYNSMSQNSSLMNRSLVQAYHIVYQKLPRQYQDIFVNSCITRLGEIIDTTENLLKKTRESQSYRLGNFFAKKLRKGDGF